jgi:hypothetical protein
VSAPETTTELPEGVTRQEYDELVASVKDLRSALEDAAKAKPDEVAEAKHEVGKAKAALDAAASDLGIDPKRLRELADSARADDEKQRLRTIVLEILDEEIADEPATEEEGDKPAEEEAAPAEDTPPTEDDPEPDTGPVDQHWSDKPLSSFLGR